jgi:hypothetical protein
MPPSIGTGSVAWKRLRTADADQHGRFYPANGFAPALLQLDPSHGVNASISELTRESLMILERHKIPTH